MERKAREKEENKVSLHLTDRSSRIVNSTRFVYPQAVGAVYFPWGGSKPERDESGKIRRRKWILGRDENTNPDKKVFTSV